MANEPETKQAKSSAGDAYEYAFEQVLEVAQKGRQHLCHSGRLHHLSLNFRNRHRGLQDGVLRRRALPAWWATCSLAVIAVLLGVVAFKTGLSTAFPVP